MTIDDVRAAAEKAKKWRPKVCERVFDQTNGEMAPCHGCDRCHGAKRAVEDIAELIDEAALELDQVWWCAAHQEYVQPDHVTYEERHDPRAGGCGGSVQPLLTRRVECATSAARIASYFASEPNPVSEFRDAVRKFVEAGK